MRDGTLESMIKPWWATAPAFWIMLILASLMTFVFFWLRDG